MGRHTNKGHFKKGDKRINRKGAPKIPEEVKELRKLTSVKFAEYLEKYLFDSLDNLNKKQKNKKLSTLELIFIRAIQKSIAKGDYYFVKDCIERVLGKPKQAIDHTTDGEKIDRILVEVVESKK